MDRMDALKVFIRVSELGSFSRTAEDLALPRATVSAAVAQLEALLGARLLQRTTRKVSLTHDGVAILEHAHRMVEDFDTLQHQFRATSAPVSGRLSVDLPSRIARRIVIPALAQFLASHPDLEIILGADDRRIDLVEEGVDCAIHVGPLADSSLVARPLGMIQLINCASPGYLAANPKLQHLDDLNRHCAIHYGLRRSSSMLARETAWDYVDAAGVTRQRMVRCRVSVHTAETYIASAVAGLGLVQIPAFDVRDARRRGELVEILPHWRPAPMPMHALYPHRKHLSLRVQTFLNWLEALIQSKLDKS